MDDSLYNYKADLVRVVDGDTIVVKLHLGLGVVFEKFKIRLARINTPEMREAGGPEAKEFFQKFLKDHSRMIVVTLKDKKDKYGRYLCEVFVAAGEEWINMSDKLVEKGLAAMYKSGVEEQLNEFIY